MGRYSANTIEKRSLKWGYITFGHKQRILVDTPEMTIVFHRYGAPRGHYVNSWIKFHQALKSRKLESIYDVYKYADRYDISHFVKSYHLIGKKSARNTKGGK